MAIKLPWMKNKETEELEISLPDEVQKKLDGAASKEDVAEIKNTLAEFQKSIQSISLNAAQEAEERKKAADRKAAEEATKKSAETDEEINELFLNNPAEAMRRVMQGNMGARDTALMRTMATNLRRETFENADKYKFYTGKIKEEVDKLINQQDLKAQNDSTVLEHAYFSVLGQHLDEITEGKLKSRFAASEGGSHSSGDIDKKETDRKGPRKLDDDEKKAAKMLGFSDDDYGKLLDEVPSV